VDPKIQLTLTRVCSDLAGFIIQDTRFSPNSLASSPEIAELGSFA
jgi:hypothetical protein